MGKENVILIGTNASQTSLKGRSSNFSGRNLNERLPSSALVWGRVLTVNTSDKSIVYSLIDDVIGYVKTGTAIPLNLNNITLPTEGSIVSLSKGPDTNINNNAGQYSKTIYYGDPIGVQQTVNNNIVKKEPPPSAPVPSPSCPTCPPINPPKNPVNNGKLTGEYIFSKQLTTNVWSVVYGGIDINTKKANTYGAKYMQQQATSAGVINSKNFVFSDYTNNISSLTGELQKQYPGATINSVICFSKSGESVWSLVGKYNFVGFMDPSTPSWVDDNTNKTCENKNIRMIYNPVNWGKGTSLSNRLVHVGARMKTLHTATETSAGHFTIPQTFYKTYISLF
jgi:hypothetical protein